MSFVEFKRSTSSRVRFNMFMLWKLPSSWICGIRLESLDDSAAVVSVPYRWLTQNPFRSIYFACQAMAAEMSTGLLAMGHLHGRKPAVSMLVTSIEANFSKKAVSRIYFTCADGSAILQAIESSVSQGEGTSVVATSIGKNQAGEVVSVFKVEWSFKARHHAPANK